MCIGGQCQQTVLLLAGSSSGLLVGDYEPSAGWTTSTLSGGTPFDVTLSIDSAGRAVGAWTPSNGGLVTATIWANGSWSAPGSLNVSAVARAEPHADGTSSSGTYLLYQDTTYHYYSMSFTGTWSSPQAVGPSGNQLYGPTPATVAALGNSATAAFIDGLSPLVNDVATTDYSLGSWQARNDVVGPESYNFSPQIIALSSGPELMVAFVDSNNQVEFTTRTAGVWSSAAGIANVFTNDAVALASLPGGGAVLAIRGQDTNLYWSIYSSGAWSPVAALTSTSISIATSPAVTHGIAGDTAEIAFIENDGKAYHSRLISGAWSTPVLLGGASLNGIAITAP